MLYFLESPLKEIVERCVENKYEVDGSLRVMCHFHLYAAFNRAIISH